MHTERKSALPRHLEQHVPAVNQRMDEILREVREGKREAIGSQTELARHLRAFPEIRSAGLSFRQIERILRELRARGVAVPKGVSFTGFSEKRKKEVLALIRANVPRMSQEEIKRRVDFIKEHGVIEAAKEFGIKKGSVYTFLKRLKKPH